MNLRHVHFAAVCLGAAIAAACGGNPTLNVQPAAALRTAPAAASNVGSAQNTGDRCDASRWLGAISPEGRPDRFDAGDTGAVYIWHDSDGWHLRSTDQRPTDHHYTGTIHLAPSGTFTDIRPVRDERDDRVFVDGDNILHYDFHTFASIDGVDFRVTCSQRKRDAQRQRLAFRTMFDGRPDADRVRIGDGKRTPEGADFTFVRSA